LRRLAFPNGTNPTVVVIGQHDPPQSLENPPLVRAEEIGLKAPDALRKPRVNPLRGNRVYPTLTPIERGDHPPSASVATPVARSTPFPRGPTH